MNWYSKCIKTALILMLIFTGPGVRALNIHALYTAYCQRILGIIIEVNDTEVTILTKNGEVKKIPRYKIIYMTDYSIDKFTAEKIRGTSIPQMINIRTSHNKQMVHLVTGWPVDYSEENISFIDSRGHESVISRNSIWELSFQEGKSPEQNTGEVLVKSDYDYIRPYLFEGCSREGKKPETTEYRVPPRQLLSNNVMIKKELDRLQEGREKILDYVRWQQFYPVPREFGNNTSLGYWGALGSRYGESKSRNGNLSPILQNEFSSGPFGYQHRILTGNAPIFNSIIEEPQTQIFYHFKVNYLHMAVMGDPNLVLLPRDKYAWKREDMEGVDDRVNEMFSGELGIDYGYFSIQGYISSNSLGVSVDDMKFFSGKAWIPRVGVTFRNYLIKLELQYGFGYENNVRESVNYPDLDQILYVNPGSFRNTCGYRTSRLNLYFDITGDFSITYSLIWRRLNFQRRGGLSDGWKQIYQIDMDLLEYYQQQISDPAYAGSVDSIQEQIDRIQVEIAAIETAEERLQASLFRYDSDSFTNAIYLRYTWKHKFIFGSSFSLEWHRAHCEYGREKRDKTSYYPKLGLMASMFF